MGESFVTDPATDNMQFAANDATLSDQDTKWNDTAPTSTVFSVGSSNMVTGSGQAHIAYCFADVQGFSKFGSYLGNGEALNGPFVYTGFKPAFIIIKHTSTTNRAWYMFDTARNPHNPNGLKFYADTAAAEGTDQSIYMMSNGFQVSPSALGSYGTDSVNSSGNKMIYAAWAENPFVTSGGTPATAR
jgi:hypothetical protein